MKTLAFQKQEKDYFSIMFIELDFFSTAFMQRRNLKNHIHTITRILLLLALIFSFTAEKDWKLQNLYHKKKNLNHIKSKMLNS